MFFLPISSQSRNISETIYISYQNNNIKFSQYNNNYKKHFFFKKNTYKHEHLCIELMQPIQPLTQSTPPAHCPNHILFIYCFSEKNLKFDQLFFLKKLIDSSKKYLLNSKMIGNIPSNSSQNSSQHTFNIYRFVFKKQIDFFFFLSIKQKRKLTKHLDFEIELFQIIENNLKLVPISKKHKQLKNLKIEKKNGFISILE